LPKCPKGYDTYGVSHACLRTVQAITVVTSCIILIMKRNEILYLIHENYDQLTKLGVKSLAVFGSVARVEATQTSDVDILVEFEGKATFDRFMDTKFFLEDLLGLRVDLVMPGAIKPRMKPYIMQDLVYVT
jgi:predicted nucleotidyltransferase